MIRTAVIFLSLICVTANGYFIRSAVDACASREFSAAIHVQPLASCGSVFSNLPVLIVTQWFGLYRGQSSRGAEKRGNGKAGAKQSTDFILAGFENTRLEKIERLITVAAGAVCLSKEEIDGWVNNKKLPPGFLECGIHGLLRWWSLFIILCARRGFGDYILFNNKADLNPIRL